MLSVLRDLVEILNQGETVALATVVRTRGSVPQQVGAKMVVHPFGKHRGTIGGGCGEAAVMRAALDVIQTGKPTIASVDMTGEITADSGAICGGLMDIYVERIPSRSFGLDDLNHALHVLEGRKSVALVSVLSAPAAALRSEGEKTAIGSVAELVQWLGEDSAMRGAYDSAKIAFTSRRPLITEGWPPDQLRPSAEQPVLFIEPLRHQPHLVIVGAGHIAQPLAKIGNTCGFRVTVLDDRAKFASPQRFPDADQVIANKMAESLNSMDLNPDSYVVLVTRGHQHDVECLLEVVNKPLGYLGMIGSRRRVRGVFDMLQQEQGMSEDLFAHVHSPIGLDIGAKTPAEIAVAIMAEVINEYRGGQLSRVGSNLGASDPGVAG